MTFYNLHAIVLQELFVDGIFPINLRHVHKYLRSQLVNHIINRVRMEKNIDLFLYSPQNHAMFLEFFKIYINDI